MQVLGRATGPELGQQVHAACAGPVLIPIACAQPYLGRPVPGEDDDRHRRSSFNRRGGENQWTVKKPLLMASVSNPCSEKAGAWASVGCAPGPSDAVGRGALARARPGVRTMQHLEARCHQSRLLLGATCAARTSCLSRTVQSTATCTFAVRCSSVQALRQAATKVWVTKVGDQDRTARNWKYALIRCLRSVWMGSSPSRKLKNTIGKCAS